MGGSLGKDRKSMLDGICLECLWNRERERCAAHPDYGENVRKIMESRGERDTAPYLVSLFDQAYAPYGQARNYDREKKMYNDFVLDRAGDIRTRIRKAPDPLFASLMYARCGNYIDFATLDQVDTEDFLRLLDTHEVRKEDRAVYGHFREACGRAKSILLITDNTGEIVLDRLMAEEIHRAFPKAELQVMTRGGSVQNDATKEDAVYVGMDRVARILSSGSALAGTVPERLSPEAAGCLCSADVILSKGQGNYETLIVEDLHVFHLFLCKCRFFTEHFHVPKLTGMMVEQTGAGREWTGSAEKREG